MELQELEARLATLERRVNALNPPADEYITPAEADRRLHVAKGTTLAAIRRGVLRCRTKPGGTRCRVSVADVEEWSRSW